MNKDNEIKINGKTYALVPDTIGDRSECNRCALKDCCHEECEYGLCQYVYGVDNARGKVFEEIPDEEVLTEKEVYDYYQERSVNAGERAELLAWMFIVMMTGGLISGHAFQTFSICSALAVIYMLLSVLQAVWQTFTSWLFMRQINRHQLTPKDCPAWIGCGAWAFFWLKMISIASAVMYFAKAIFF